MKRLVKRKKSVIVPTRTGHVHQFLVVLTRTDPIVWRRIQVPGAYSFWDLHVAIQDAMGWEDRHLHEFRLLDSRHRLITLGIPTDVTDRERPLIPSWEVFLEDVLESGEWHAPHTQYTYDFGDEWMHVVAHEAIEPAKASRSYPRCLAGARRCPPEDCGGPHRYEELLAALADRKHPEHRAMLDWVGGALDPDDFSPSAVVFDDPRKRWANAFKGPLNGL